MIQFLLNSEEGAVCDAAQLVEISDLANIKIVTSINAVSGVHLLVHREMLSLANKDDNKVLPVAVDFLKPMLKKRFLTAIEVPLGVTLTS